MSDLPPNAPVEDDALNGPKILLVGDSGTGKTFALGTIVDWAQAHGFKCRALFTENGLETLLGYWRDPPLGTNGQPIRPARPIPECLAWHVLRDKPLGLDALKKAANQAGIMTYKALTEMQDPERSVNNAYEKMLNVLGDFPDDRTGKKLGNIGTWGRDTILLWDSLTETGELAMKMIVGKKPTASPPDYGVAQNNLMNLLRYLTQGFEPTVVMTAHVQRQVIEATGGMVLTVKGPGKALGDDIPRQFSEVISTRREGTDWVWDTTGIGTVTKTRYLPINGKIKPDLGQIMDKWEKRRKAT
jgi:hypothetical protein